MWRIKTLTEQFGPCGIGWYIETEKQWIEAGPEGRVAAFCNINLYIKQNGEWSKPITATGGSMLADIENSQLRTSDECYKMAHTDAISVACKMLGFGADIYWQKDRTKYDAATDAAQRPVKDKVDLTDTTGKKVGRSEDDQTFMICSMCDTEITDKVHDFSVQKYGKPLCYTCQKKV